MNSIDPLMSLSMALLPSPLFANVVLHVRWSDIDAVRGGEGRLIMSFHFLSVTLFCSSFHHSSVRCRETPAGLGRASNCRPHVERKAPPRFAPFGAVNYNGDSTPILKGSNVGD